MNRIQSGRACVRLIFTIFAVAILQCSLCSSAGAKNLERVEIMRDTYGIPHIFANTPEAGMYALGWATAEDKAYRFLFDVIAAQGRLLEFWNDSSENMNWEYLARDRASLGMGYYDLAADWTALPEDVRAHLCAFTAGFNDYLKQVEKSGKFETRFPVINGFSSAEIIRAFGALTPRHLAALAIFINGEAGLSNLTPEEWETMGGIQVQNPGGASNAIAMNPSLVKENAAVIYGDLHDPWSDTEFMAHLHVDGKDIFGSFNGPYFIAGRGNQVGLAFTRHKPDAGDVFIEKINPGKFDEYKFGTQWRTMTNKSVTLKVRNSEDISFPLYYTHHGWVWDYPPTDSRIPGVAHSVSIAAVNPNILADGHLKYVAERIRTPWLESVSDHYHLNHIPANSARNFVLADTSGNISYIWGGKVPVRYGDFNPDHNPDTSKPVVGWTLLNDWNYGTWRLGDPVFQLPYYLNPRGGIVRSANDAPWYATTCDKNPRRPDWIPAHIVPLYVDYTTRGLLLRKLSCNHEIKSMDDVRDKLAFNTLSQDSLFFIQAIERGWRAHEDSLREIELSPDAKKEDQILRSWNARADVDQSGMTAMFILRRNTDLPWFPEDYTPSLEEMLLYLQDIELTAALLQYYYGSVDVTWGQIHFILRGNERIPLPGGTESIPTLFMASMGSFIDEGGALRDNVYGDMDYQTDAQYKGYIMCKIGSSIIHAHVMDPENPVSYAITPIGQTDIEQFPDSPHILQQTRLFSEKKWMRIPLKKEDVEQNLCPWGQKTGHEHPTVTVLAPDIPDILSRFQK